MLENTSLSFIPAPGELSRCDITIRHNSFRGTSAFDSNAPDDPVPNLALFAPDGRCVVNASTIMF
jgi:hypothetical protein